MKTMNKILIFSLTFFCFGITLHTTAQSRPEVKPQKDLSFSLFELLPVPGKGYVSVLIDNQEAPTKVRLAFTGATETVESVQEISLLRRGLSAMVESAFIWDGQVTLVTSLFYPGPQRDLLFARRYRIPDLEEVASEKIAEAYVPGRLRVPFGYALAPDSSKVMFYSWSYAVPEDPVKMEIHVLDRQLERLWNKRFLLPNKNENFFVYACQVDNAGNTYLLCEDYKGKIGSGSRIRDEKIERFVLRLAKDSQEATAFSIQLEDHVITDLRFTMDPAGNLIGAGFYREKGKSYQAGVFAYRIDQKTLGFKKWQIPIDKDTYQKMHAYSNDKGKHISGTRRFRDYYLDQLVWSETEGLTLIGEQRIYEEDEDKYYDIMIVQLDTNFRKKWATRVPKKQAASWAQLNFVSYRFLQRGENQYLLFNDHQDNMPTAEGVPNRIKTLDFMFTSPQPVLHLVKIGNNGRLQHQNVSAVIETKSRMALVPYLTRSDRQNSFLLYLRNLSSPDGIGKVFPISWAKEGG